MGKSASPRLGGNRKRASFSNIKSYQIKPLALTQPATLTRLPSLLRRLAAFEQQQPDAPQAKRRQKDEG